MHSDLLSLGIDTSNYKTSVAVTNCRGDVLFNHQEYLDVKRGERGLRQSEAFFQHVQKLPAAIEKALSVFARRENIGAVSVSTRPRPIEGSYMPVFTAGSGYGRAVAAALGVPCYEFSHQEGHIEAVRFYSELKNEKRLISFHFSGGTTEAILLDETENRFEIVGGTKDIAYGQVLDRVGVALGLDFPCGNALDRMALLAHGHRNILTPIRVKAGYVNLSGIESQCSRLLGKEAQVDLVEDLFEKLSQSVMDMTLQLSHQYGITNFLYAGGVSCSRFLRNYMAEHMYKDLNLVFGRPEMSADNAIGISLLGGRNLWH